MQHNTNDPLGKRIKTAKKKTDWFGFFVQFFFGAIVGGVMAVFNTDTYNKDAYIFSIILYAIVTGLLAGIFGNKFWNIFKNWWGNGRM